MTQASFTPEPNHQMIITDGTIQQLNYFDHRRARNWVASVQRNLKAPGGLDRHFWARSGSTAIVPHDLRAATWIEQAGDYYTGGGNPEYHRIYVRVIDVTPDHIEVVEVKKKEIGKVSDNDPPRMTKVSDNDPPRMTQEEAKAELGRLLFRSLCLIDAHDLDHKPTRDDIPRSVLRELKGNASMLVNWACLEFPTK